MIYVGIDDTDLLDTPGTNQLARHLVDVLRDDLQGRVVLRHQLLEDPRVPCTRKNGSASIEFLPTRPVECTTVADRIERLMLDWIPVGSDPGLCVADAAAVRQPIVDWGRRAQRELLDQSEARRLADQHRFVLRGLAGTQDGVIGALAAVGLMATRDDGRVVYLAASHNDQLDVCGTLPIDTVLARGIDEVREINTQQSITSGTIEVEKKLRPNYRQGRVVLYASHIDADQYKAVRVT